MLEPSDVLEDDFLVRLAKLGKWLNLAVELRVLAGDVRQLYQMSLLYTMVRFFLAMGMLKKEDATLILKRLLNHCIPLCISSDHLAFYCLAVEKAAKDGIINNALSRFFVNKAAGMEHTPHVRMMDDFEAFIRDANALIGNVLAGKDREDLSDQERLLIVRFCADESAISAVNTLRQRLVAFGGSNQELQSHLFHYAKSLSKPAQMDVRHHQETIHAAFQERRNKALDAGSSACRAMVGAILWAHRSRSAPLPPPASSLEFGPHETLFTRIIDFGDAKHIRKALQLARSTYPRKCKGMGFSFEDGHFAAYFGNVRSNHVAENNKKENSMYLLGAFCHLVSQGPKCAVHDEASVRLKTFLVLAGLQVGMILIGGAAIRSLKSLSRGRS